MSKVWRGMTNFVSKKIGFVARMGEDNSMNDSCQK